MASVPQLLKIAIFTLGGTDFTDDVLDVEVVSEPGDTQSVTTLDGVTHSDISAETWALRIRAIHDWDTVRPGLASYLYTNKGTAVTFVLADSTAAFSTTKPAITGSVVCVPLSYGGNGNEFAESEVTMPINGTPTLDTTP